MQSESECVPWSQVATSQRKFLKPVIKKWQTLIISDRAQERQVHAYLAKHAHLFLWDGLGFATVISKLRFGAEFISDFVSVYDRWSNGIQYTLIEIERPQTPPFTKDGVASARLSRAIQQVLSWKSWLSEHTTEARRLFPSFMFHTGEKPIFNFEIIIGTRKNARPWFDRRRALSEALGISIRSFDSLTDRLQKAVFVHDFSSIGDEAHRLDADSRNKLACPFINALTDSDWRLLIREGNAINHFMGGYGKLLLKYRRENELAERFRELHAKRRVPGQPCAFARLQSIKQ